MVKEVTSAYFNEIRFEIMAKLEKCHDLLSQLPDNFDKEMAYDHIEEAHNYIQDGVQK